MKLINKFFIYLICTAILNIIISCSTTKKIDNNQNLPLNQFSTNNIKNEYTNITKQIQLEIQALQIENTIYFPLDQYDISIQFFNTLNNHANFLRNNSLYHIKIEGHADERGTPEYNIALGERRANSVKLYLQSKGVLSKQIFTVSYGKEKPAILEHNEEAYSKNRRAVLVFY